jgi:hypothetical protein
MEKKPVESLTQLFLKATVAAKCETFCHLFLDSVLDKIISQEITLFVTVYSFFIYHVSI